MAKSELNSVTKHCFDEHICTCHDAPYPTLLLALSSHKTLRIKQFLAKHNGPFPQWTQMKTANKIRYNFKRKHWRRMKLGL
ncbi:60S ribosomal protein L39-like isoform X1 [Cricetulus griseus]|nr:60S ribosomal protein L39-like isoform X1 [Cricetulus griseus]